MEQVSVDAVLALGTKLREGTTLARAQLLAGSRHLYFVYVGQDFLLHAVCVDGLKNYHTIVGDGTAGDLYVLDEAGHLAAQQTKRSSMLCVASEGGRRRLPMPTLKLTFSQCLKVFNYLQRMVFRCHLWILADDHAIWINNKCLPYSS